VWSEGSCWGWTTQRFDRPDTTTREANMSSAFSPGEERGETLWRADYSKQEAASAGYRIKSNNLDALPRDVPAWPPPVITPEAPVPHPPGT
jgi:hypothetical protein